MRFTGLGQIIFALSMAAIGALSLAMPGFGSEWPSVPHWLAGYSLIIRGVILVVAGLALLIPRTAALAALVLAIYLALRLLAVSLYDLAAHPLIEVYWEQLGENLVELAGALALYAMLAHEGVFARLKSAVTGRGAGALAQLRNARVAQILFGLALLPIGLSHGFYLKHTAELIPSWIPLHVPLAYATGAGHFAAGVAILVGVVARLAATLEAVMVSLFTLIIWVPAVMAHPSNVDNLGEICASAAISGAAWAIAESLRSKAD